MRCSKSGSHHVAPEAKSPNSASRSHRGRNSQYPLGALASALRSSSEGPAYAPHRWTISATTEVPLRSTPRTMIGRLSELINQDAPQRCPITVRQPAGTREWPLRCSQPPLPLLPPVTNTQAVQAQKRCILHRTQSVPPCTSLKGFPRFPICRREPKSDGPERRQVFLPHRRKIEAAQNGVDLGHRHQPRAFPCDRLPPGSDLARLAAPQVGQLEPSTRSKAGHLRSIRRRESLPQAVEVLRELPRQLELSPCVPIGRPSIHHFCWILRPSKRHAPALRILPQLVIPVKPGHVERRSSQPQSF